jgi:hypothetical protein
MNILITIPEADGFLLEYPEWDSLDSDIKDIHIRKASAYVCTNWDCDDLDFSVTADIPSDIKEATAQYAYASYAGNLFMGTDGERAYRIRSESGKSGPSSSSYEYSPSMGVHGNPLSYPESLMSLALCTKKASGGVLERV